MSEVRLIDANALKEDLKQYFSDGTLDSVSAKLAFNMILRKIDNAPAVHLPDGCKRPNGTWVKTGQSLVNPNKFRNFCCSNCLWELDEHIRIEPNFCPNCGADMRGKEE